MFTKSELQTLLELVRKEKQYAWSYSKEETPYIEELNDIQTKVEELLIYAPECNLCNDSGFIPTSTEVKGRDIDNIIKCNCKK